jgi:hypothetical protein
MERRAEEMETEGRRLDLAARQIAATLARLYPDADPQWLHSMARQMVPFLGGFGGSPSAEK